VGVFGYDAALDISLVKAARTEAGPDVDIMVDGGWYGTAYGNPYKSRPVKDWKKIVKKLEELNIFWLEDFIHPENIKGYARVSKAAKSLRIAAGEQASGVYEFERLAEEGKVDVLQPDPSRCGGLTIGKQVADLAMRRQIDCAPHAWLTDILKAASLHLNAYLMNSLYLEYNVSSAPLLKDLCRNKIKMVDGYIEVPDGPGLGVDVDEKTVEKYRVM
jgi:L-alanine-DL-glutamate epimerase-like enolase superfamily enzyme